MGASLGLQRPRSLEHQPVALVAAAAAAARVPVAEEQQVHGPRSHLVQGGARLGPAEGQGRLAVPRQASGRPVTAERRLPRRVRLLDDRVAR